MFAANRPISSLLVGIVYFAEMPCCDAIQFLGRRPEAQNGIHQKSLESPTSGPFCAVTLNAQFGDLMRQPARVRERACLRRGPIPRPSSSTPLGENGALVGAEAIGWLAIGPEIGNKRARGLCDSRTEGDLVEVCAPNLWVAENRAVQSVGSRDAGIDLRLPPHCQSLRTCRMPSASRHRKHPTAAILSFSLSAAPTYRRRRDCAPALR